MKKDEKKLCKGLSLSVNSKHSQKSAFFAVTEFFADSFRKFNKIINHIHKPFLQESSFSTSDASPFIKNNGNKGLSTNILKRTLNVILGFIPRIHIKHFFPVILGFIPRIHAKNSPLLDTRVRLFVTPEYDHQWNFTKSLDVVCQCATLLERLKTHIKTNSLFCHPRAWLLARPEDLDSRVKPEYNGEQSLIKGVDKAVSSGRSMIEMLGVLAIIGVLSVGGIAGYSKAMEKIHVNKIVNMISDISATIKTAYISQKTYDNFDSGLVNDAWDKIQDMGLLPPEYTFEFEVEKRIGLSSPLTLINPVGYGEDDIFSVLSIGVLVPQNLCVPLLTYDWRNADMKGIVIAPDNYFDLGYGALWGYAFTLSSDQSANCNDASLNDAAYYCIEFGKQRFKPVSPAVAAKYCESFAADSFGTGQMYVKFDLLADIKVP